MNGPACGLQISKLNTLTDQLQRQGKWVNIWEKLAGVLPSTIGPVPTPGNIYT